MPSPRPLGSGILKILPLPHCLQDEFLNLIAFPSYLSEPQVRSVFHRLLGSSSARWSPGAWCISAGSSAVSANVAVLLAVVALYLLQISLLPFFSKITVSRGKRGSCIGLVLLFSLRPHPPDVSFFCDALPYSSAVGRGIHSIWISARGSSSRSERGERIVHCWVWLPSIPLLLIAIIAVFVDALSFNCGSLPVFVVSWSVQAQYLMVQFRG